MSDIRIVVVIKMEPDFSEGNVSYNPDGTLNRAETKNILGPHSAVAAKAAFYAKVRYGARISVATMGPPIADQALQQAQELCDADALYLYSDRLFAGADTLATAEVLRAGIGRMEKPDLVFAGHRASDGETGQTGPQLAWKLGYPFFGHVIDYELDPRRRTILIRRIVSLQGLDDYIEEVEAPLPVFISIDPSYKARYVTVSQRLGYERFQREARLRAGQYKRYLKVLDVEELEADQSLVGLSGSPTIVYKVERIPKGKSNRQAKVLDGSNPDHIRYAASKILESLSSPVIK